MLPLFSTVPQIPGVLNHGLTPTGTWTNNNDFFSCSACSGWAITGKKRKYWDTRREAKFISLSAFLFFFFISHLPRRWRGRCQGTRDGQHVINHQHKNPNHAYQVPIQITQSMPTYPRMLLYSAFFERAIEYMDEWTDGKVGYDRTFTRRRMRGTMASASGGFVSGNW